MARETEREALVPAAADEDGGGIGRIRLQHTADAWACSLQTFVLASVAPESVVRTDGWDGYSGIEEFGYKHRVTVLARPKKQPHELLPRVRHVAPLLKRWILGTYQGAISHDHLGFYLDEFTSRFNLRRSASWSKLFFRLAQQAVQVGRTPMESLLKPQSVEGG